MLLELCVWFDECVHTHVNMWVHAHIMHMLPYVVSHNREMHYGYISLVYMYVILLCINTTELFRKGPTGLPSSSNPVQILHTH